LPTAELPPEAWAVIKEGSPQPAEATQRTLELAKPKPPPPKPVRDSSTETDLDGEGSLGRALVPLSVRIQSALADRLLKVAFERKMQRKAPFSQQDIVTQAVTQWLRRGGYLD